MAHTYQPITVADRTYTPVSDVTPPGTAEDKFTWANTYPNYDTWVELGARAHWCDWYFATPYTDDWASLTTPSKTYTSKTRSNRTYTSVTAPSATYSEVTK